MGLPAGVAEHDIALLELVIVGGGDLIHRPALHHVIDADWLCVGRRVAHAPAHVGIERKPFRLEKHLSWPGLRYGKVLKTEIGGLRLAHRAGSKHNTAGGFGHGDLPGGQPMGLGPTPWKASSTTTPTGNAPT